MTLEIVSSYVGRYKSYTQVTVLPVRTNGLTLPISYQIKKSRAFEIVSQMDSESHLDYRGYGIMREVVDGK